MTMRRGLFAAPVSGTPVLPSAWPIPAPADLPVGKPDRPGVRVDAAGRQGNGPSGGAPL